MPIHRACVPLRRLAASSTALCLVKYITLFSSLIDKELRKPFRSVKGADVKLLSELYEYLNYSPSNLPLLYFGESLPTETWGLPPQESIQSVIN